MELKGKVAIITGSTSGIGEATAKELARNGVNVVINGSKSEDKGKKIVEGIKKIGSDAIFVKANITKEDEVKNLINKTIEKFGRIDILVNNASDDIAGFIENLKTKDWDFVVDINLKAPFLCTKHSIPHLKKTEGIIINISSRLGIKPVKECSAYCSSKAALINFTKTSALELSRYGIRVNCICPGATDTPLLHRVYTKEEIENMKKSSPLGRIGKPEDIAKTILFLCTEGEYINGGTIVVDGGSILK